MTQPTETRISRARAAVDEARCLVAEVMDELSDNDEWQVAHWLKEGRQKLNDAIRYLEKIQ